MSVFVIASDGTRLTPTTECIARKLLKSGNAVIASYRPYFTIKLNYTPENIDDSPMEISVDTGSEHIGISAKSDKHEYLSEQRDNLSDEKEKHDAQRKTRRNRRNRKRYRKARFDNRKKDEGSLAPSLAHKKDNHIYLITELLKVFPAKEVWLEMGVFDTQALAAIEQGKPLPQGTDYQQGPRYKRDTLRDAVFYRDNFTCLVCGKSSITDGVILCEHHLGFRKKDRSNRMNNLASVCTKCHTSANHKEGGALWDFSPTLKPLKDAAFMNTVRWIMYNELSAIAADYGAKVCMTYGTVTKRERKDRCLAKSHAIDAYCIGRLHPKHRAHTVFYKKKRRNNRCLQTFYDAWYIDVRTGEKKRGAQLGCNRTNRSIPRNNENNLRMYRGKKVSKGRISIRKSRYEIKPGCPLLYTHATLIDGKIQTVKEKIVSAGVKDYGRYVVYKGIMTLPLSDIAPATVGKDKVSIPIAPGNKCLYIGGRAKKTAKYLMIRAVDEKTQAVSVDWIFSAKISDVKLLRYGSGWEKYTPVSQYIYGKE